MAVESTPDGEAVETGEQKWHDELAGRLWVALDALANGGTRQVAIGQLLKARDLLAVQSRHVASSSTREDGETLGQQRHDLAAEWADPQAQWFAAVLLDIADSLRRLTGASS